MRPWGRGLATLLALAGTAVAAPDHPHKTKPAPHPASKPHWELPLPVERKPADAKPLFGDRRGEGPPDRSMHFGTVTVTPGGFLSLDTGRAHD